MENINLITIFTTGLITGGLTCMAVQGGLLAATIANREQELLLEQAKSRESKAQSNAMPILAFLVAKLIGYTLFGFLLGWLGSFLTLSVQTQIILQLVVVAFMIGTAFNMLNIHPIFRYFIIQPPRFLSRFVRKQAKRKDIFAPAVLGFFTVFIPCGTTQAMMVLAIGTANPILGALIMFAFVLGTSPIFFVLGYFTTKLSDVFQKNFTRIAAAAIILLALFNLNNTLALAGNKYTFDKILGAVNCAISFCSAEQSIARSDDKVVDTVWIELTDAGYKPNVFTVSRGKKVTLNLINKTARGCIQAFTIPQLNIQRVIPIGTEERITFTAPDQPGEITFTCSMGMYPGVIKVI